MDYNKVFEINKAVGNILDESSDYITEEDVKSLFKSWKDSDHKDAGIEKKIKKELKSLHANIVKSFDKNVKDFMKAEEARLKSEYKDFSIGISPVSSRGIKDVSGNSDSQFGDWYDALEYRLSITHKV